MDILRLDKCLREPKAQLINPKETTCKSNRTMKKGKKSTLIVLAVEILTIVVLHAVKISQSEKVTSTRESIKNASTTSENQPDSKSGSSVFSFAAYK
jgi:hypothetical protein